MFEVIVVLLLLYLIWSTESNFKVVDSNQKEIGKELELLKGAKNTEQQVQPDNAEPTVIATFYVTDEDK